MKFKLGIYMNAGGQLFQLLSVKDKRFENVILGNGSKYVLMTDQRMVKDEGKVVDFIMPGMTFEIARLIDGMEYLGKL